MPSIWKAANHTSYCPSVSCIIFDIDITSWKRNGHQTRSFFVCKDSHKKDMSEFWGLNVTSPMKAGVHTTRGLIHIQREARDSRRPFPSIRWYHVFWERNIKRGVLPSCGIKKIPHMWYKMHFSVVLKKVPHMWYKNEHRGIKRYHICGTFCRCE